MRQEARKRLNMEKAQLPRKELSKENRKKAMEIPISGYLLLGGTGGVTHWNPRPS